MNRSTIFGAQLTWLLVAGAAWGTTIDAGAPGSTTHLAGRVLSTLPDPTSRTTLVVLGDEAGREVGRFRTLGARVGRVQWIAEGFPVFTPGDQVEVGLAPGGEDLAIGTGGAAEVRRLAPTRSAAFERALAGEATASVTEVVPPAGGAVPETALVTVHGSGFGATQGESTVSFLGLFERVDAAVVSWADDAIVCRVPTPGLLGAPQVLSGPVKVWTPTGGWSDGDPYLNGGSFNVLYQWAGDHWPTARLPIGVWVNPGHSPYGDGLGALCAEASARWNVPGSYARFVYRGLTGAEGGDHGNPATPKDGRNTVLWRTTWPYLGTILAITWSSVDTLTFEREEVEIEINGTRPWTLDPDIEVNKFDLSSTLTHEFGHWLRLGHTQRVPSVMTAFASAGEKKREISEGDSYGASWIYPSYGAVAMPLPIDEVDGGGSFAFALTALDREGKPRANLPAELLSVRAVKLTEDEQPGALDPPLERAPAAVATALAATNIAGRTGATLAGLADGRYRLETTIDGKFVRPAVIARVGAAPAPPVYPLAFARVTSPLLPGTHGRVRFTLPASGPVTIDLYDARGRRVRALAAGTFAAGPNEVALETMGTNGRRLGAGVYYLRLATASRTATSRVVVLP